MKKYYLGILVYCIIFLLGTWYTYRDDRPADGPLSFGFPIPFYHGGGFCRVSCGPDFYWQPLIIDVLFLILPIMGAYWYYKRRNPSLK